MIDGNPRVFIVRVFFHNKQPERCVCFLYGVFISMNGYRKNFEGKNRFVK